MPSHLSTHKYKNAANYLAPVYALVLQTNKKSRNLLVQLERNIGPESIPAPPRFDPVIPAIQVVPDLRFSQPFLLGVPVIPVIPVLPGQ